MLVSFCSFEFFRDGESFQACWSDIGFTGVGMNNNNLLKIQFLWPSTLWLMGDKKKAGALFVRLVSAAGTGFFYVKKKTKKLQTSQTKLEFRKFDHRVNRHVLFKEEKMK
ncbi:uncharacterized protein LOC132626872 isoform X1 [Lycium barbarum]|uniref:uncharacterized protein LOC132626872 isoform X1 n=2 Tax=Lycium barbarum TaxID=112863 RepID=UPI00293E9E89|nr:uncharacterized protein LOC132626872 isoform X1 [Lycium barbarum]